MTGLFVINDWLECLDPHVAAAHLSGMLVMSTMKKNGAGWWVVVVDM